MGVRVRQRNGAWWVFVNYKGRRKAKRVGDRKAAELVATKLRAKLADGDTTPLDPPQLPPAPAPVLTLADYAETWLKQHSAPGCKFSTHRVYETNLRRHILPVLGSKPLNEITRADCRALIAACREPKPQPQPVEGDSQQPKRKAGRTATHGALSPKSIENICRTLSSILSLAVDDGLIPANPAFRLGKFYRQAAFPRIEIRPFTREEAQKFLTAASEHALREHPLFLTALRTGMRLGELLGLQWGDIDFNGRFIEVRRNLVAGRLTTPKSGKSRRVDMSTQLSTTLRKLLTERKEEKLRRGWQEMPPWVFCTPEGGPLDGDNLRHRVFYRVLEKAGLRRVRFHDLRHTFASLLIQQGESLAYIKDQLGHSSIKLTVDTYGHMIPGANRAAVDRLDDTAVPTENDSEQDQSATSAQPAADASTVQSESLQSATAAS